MPLRYVRTYTLYTNVSARARARARVPRITRVIVVVVTSVCSFARCFSTSIGVQKKNGLTKGSRYARERKKEDDANCRMTGPARRGSLFACRRRAVVLLCVSRRGARARIASRVNISWLCNSEICCPLLLRAISLSISDWLRETVNRYITGVVLSPSFHGDNPMTLRDGSIDR